MYYKYANTQNVDREKELITMVQKYDDKFAMKELVAMYQGALYQCVIKSNIMSNGMDMPSAMNAAEAEFKKYVKTCDINSNNKPSTYLIGNVTKRLTDMKYDDAEGVSRMSNSNSRYKNYDVAASDWLVRQGIEPTAQNSNDLIRNEFKKGGEGLSVDKIERTRKLSRGELFGDKTIGSSDSSAEAITFSEAFGQKSGVSGSEFMFEDQKKREIKEIISGPDFSRGERLFIRKWIGLDNPLGLLSTPTPHQAALNAGITDAQAAIATKKLKEKLEAKKGL